MKRIVAWSVLVLMSAASVLVADTIFRYRNNVELLAGETPEDTTINFRANGGKQSYRYAYKAITGSVTFVGYLDGDTVFVERMTAAEAYSTESGPLLDSLRIDRPNTTAEARASANHH